MVPGLQLRGAPRGFLDRPRSALLGVFRELRGCGFAAVGLNDLVLALCHLGAQADVHGPQRLRLSSLDLALPVGLGSGVHGGIRPGRCTGDLVLLLAEDLGLRLQLLLRLRLDHGELRLRFGGRHLRRLHLAIHTAHRRVRLLLPLCGCLGEGDGVQQLEVAVSELLGLHGRRLKPRAHRDRRRLQVQDLPLRQRAPLRHNFWGVPGLTAQALQLLGLLRHSALRGLRSLGALLELRKVAFLRRLLRLLVLQLQLPHFALRLLEFIAQRLHAVLEFLRIGAGLLRGCLDLRRDLHTQRVQAPLGLLQLGVEEAAPPLRGPDLRLPLLQRLARLLKLLLKLADGIRRNGVAAQGGDRHLAQLLGDGVQRALHHDARPALHESSPSIRLAGDHVRQHLAQLGVQSRQRHFGLRASLLQLLRRPQQGRRHDEGAGRGALHHDHEAQAGLVDEGQRVCR
mmetsp:Transcript_57324/g.166385  ORF Transcript_57324/g.166385 Transcript_57324/m.166385 type:complete len:455 (-) Transcript_57324:911-2275(-)